MIRRFVVPFGSISSALLYFAPTLTQAAGFTTIVPDTCRVDGGCQSICDIALLAQNVLNDGIFIAVVLSAILFAWAGFNYLTAAGDPSKVKKGRELFSSVVIGLVIILAAWLIVDTIMRTFTGDKLGPWNSICTHR